MDIFDVVSEIRSTRASWHLSAAIQKLEQKIQILNAPRQVA